MPVTRKSRNSILFHNTAFEKRVKFADIKCTLTLSARNLGGIISISVSLHRQSLNSKHVAAGTTMMVAILNFLVGQPS